MRCFCLSVLFSVQRLASLPTQTERCPTRKNSVHQKVRQWMPSVKCSLTTRRVPTCRQRKLSRHCWTEKKFSSLLSGTATATDVRACCAILTSRSNLKGSLLRQATFNFFDIFLCFAHFVLTDEVGIFFHLDGVGEGREKSCAAKHSQYRYKHSQYRLQVVFTDNVLT